MKIQRLFEYFNLLVYGATTISLIALEQKNIGLALLALGVISLWGCSEKFRRNILLIYACLLVLFIIPIGTTTAFPNAFYMGIGLATVVLLPLFVTKKIYKNNLIQFPSLRERNWPKRRTFYLLLIALVGYLLIPFMLKDTNSYPNWSFAPDFSSTFQAYVGLNAVGIWDELFFVCTVLAILRGFFPFAVANFAQAILFTSFLYVLAFKGWSVIVIFLFALLQGYIFKKTKSLLFILAIHLTVDLVLHLAIVYLLYPNLFPYFLD
jgi:membrane protease YdiL (CAAX protease family)